MACENVKVIPAIHTVRPLYDCERTYTLKHLGRENIKTCVHACTRPARPKRAFLSFLPSNGCIFERIGKPQHEVKLHLTEYLRPLRFGATEKELDVILNVGACLEAQDKVAQYATTNATNPF